MAAELALSCRCLRKRFGDVQAVDGVDLDVRRGECFGLLGPNGAGKTTTVEILEGLLRADEGDVEILGHRWEGAGERALRERIGIQLQEAQLADKLTVTEVVRLYRSFYPRGRSVDDVIALVELGSKRDARYETLSGGQKQRLAIAVALVGEPDLLFLDEPTTGLDPAARVKLWEIVDSFRRGGGTIIMTTHYMEEAARLCDRLAVLDHGKIIALGSPSELIASLGADQVIEFEVAGDEQLELGSLEKLPGVEVATKRIDRYVLSAKDVTRAMPALMNELARRSLDLRTVATHQATLDDVFLSLTGRGLRDD